MNAERNLQFYNRQFSNISSPAVILPYVSIFRIDVEESLLTLLRRFVNRLLELRGYVTDCDVQTRATRAFYENCQDWGLICVEEMIAKESGFLTMADHLRANATSTSILDVTRSSRFVMTNLSTILDVQANYFIDQWKNFQAIQNQRLDFSQQLESYVAEMNGELVILENRFPPDQYMIIEVIHNNVREIQDPIRFFIDNYRDFTPDMDALQGFVDELKDYRIKLFSARREMTGIVMRIEETHSERGPNGAINL